MPDLPVDAGRVRIPPGTSLPDDREFLLGVGTLVVATGGFVAAHLAYFAGTVGGARPNLRLAWLTPALLVSGVGYALWWVLDGELAGRHALRLAGWFLVWPVAFGAAGGVVIVHQVSLGVAFVNPGYAVLSWATAGGLIGLFVGIYEVGHRRAVERARRSRQRAERLNERLTVLNRVLRHDIRNEVNVIRGHAESIVGGDVDPETSAREIVETAREVHELSERVRALESALGGETADPERLDLAAVVRDAVDGLSERYPGVEFRADLPEETPVLAHGLLDVAVREVIENGAEHNAGSAPSVEVALDVHEIEGQRRVELRVADDGPGIPDRELAVLEGNRETQLDHSRGLGLWFAQWVVRASGGGLRFEESDDSGTLVRVLLGPADADPPSAPSRNPAEANRPVD